MTSELKNVLDILGRTPAVLDALLRQLPDEWTHRNEGPDTWSPYDVMGHLIHGEKTDWIPRMNIMLSDAAERRFEPFDRFAQLSGSRDPALEDLLDEFRTLREANIAGLRSRILTEDDLERTGIHPELGTVTLRQLITTWVVHDLDHISQIVRVLASHHKEGVGPWQAYLRIVTDE